MNITKPHFDVSAGILTEEGRILITRRPEGTHLGGLWEFPGGKQEAGETAEVCLKRELMEELGIRVRMERPLATIHHAYTSKTVTLHFFLCTREEGQPTPRQGQAIRWVSVQELARLSFPPPDLKVIDILIKTFA